MQEQQSIIDQVTKARDSLLATLSKKPESSWTELEKANLDSYDKALEDARAELARLQKDSEKPKDIPKITVTAPKKEFFSQAIADQIEELHFQARLLKGDFDGLAEGFPAAAKGMNLFDVAAKDVSATFAKMPPQVQAWNQAMLENEGARIMKEVRTESEVYAAEMNKLKILVDANAISQEAYNRKVDQLKFPSLTKAIADATNLRLQLDQFATSALNTTADALTDVITGSKSAKEAFADMAKSIIRDIVAMTVKALVFRSIASVFGFSEGGGVGSFLGFAGGGYVSGPGGPTSDSIPAMLSDGEFVVNADATSKHAALLKAINDNKVPEFAEGGMVHDSRVRPVPPSMQAREVYVPLHGYGWSREDLRRFILDLNKVTKDGPALLIPK